MRAQVSIHTCHNTCVWKSDDSTLELGLSSHCGFQDCAQAIGLLWQTLFLIETSPSSCNCLLEAVMNTLATFCFNYFAS